MMTETPIFIDQKSQSSCICILMQEKQILLSGKTKQNPPRNPNKTKQQQQKTLNQPKQKPKSSGFF